MVWITTPETPCPSHCSTSGRYAAIEDWAVTGNFGCPSAAAISASSGKGRSGSSQPWVRASSRNRAALLRPISFERAISRSESPWRMRIRAWRYSYISMLLRATAYLLPNKKAAG